MKPETASCRLFRWLRLGLIEILIRRPEALALDRANAYAPADRLRQFRFALPVFTVLAVALIKRRLLRPCLLLGCELCDTRLRGPPSLASLRRRLVRDHSAPAKPLVEGAGERSKPPCPHGSDWCRSCCSAHPAGTRPPRRAASFSTEVLREHPDEKAPAVTAIGRLHRFKEKKPPSQAAPPHLKAPAGANAAGTNPRGPARHPRAGDPLDQTTAPSAPATPRWCAWFPLRQARTARFRPPAPLAAGEGCSVLPVPTHLLGVLDDPAEGLAPLCRRMCSGRGHSFTHRVKLSPGVMQGRYNHPAMVGALRPGRCSAAPSIPTSSLATAADCRP